MSGIVFAATIFSRGQRIIGLDGCAATSQGDIYPQNMFPKNALPTIMFFKLSYSFELFHQFRHLIQVFNQVEFHVWISI